MTRSFIVLFISLLLCSELSLATQDFAASLIDKSLLVNADAVMREYTLDINVMSATKVDIEEHSVVTVLNENGNTFADQVVEYSDLADVKHLEGRIYDKDGNLVKKIYASDFKLRAANANNQYYTDEMQRYYFVDYRQYPYTVEYTITTRQKHTFYFPEWSPQGSERCAIEHAGLHISTPLDIELKYNSNKVPKAVEKLVDGMKEADWDIKNICAFKEEPLTFPLNISRPYVIAAAQKFECEGYAGSRSTWNEQGKFMYELNKGRDVLSDETVAKVKEMVNGISDDRKKIDTLYRFMQHATRYVYVGYGIGGWQTQDAQFVDKNKYGDCKALSNYMKALLKAAGITAFAVEIHADDKHHYSLEKDFPYVWSNHIILCVPLSRDTVWLECTSSIHPSNYLGDFTDDRVALMLTPEGGVLVHTPVYDTNVNFKSRHARIAGADNGTLKVEMIDHYSGTEAKDLYSRICYSKPRELQDHENSKFRMSSYSVDKYDLVPVKNDPYMAVDEHLFITANSMFNKRGSRYFLNMNVAPIKINYTTMSTERKNSFYLNTSLAIKDTFVLDIPANTSIEFSPEPVSISSSFGHYSCSVINVNGQLVMTRELTEYSGTYDKALYKDYERFAAAINGGDPYNIVLTQK